MQFKNAEKSDFSIARQPIRSSSRTAFHANIDVKEYAPKQDKKTNLTFSSEGVSAFRQQSLNNTQHKITTPVTGVWSPKWNSNQAINKSSQTEPQPTGIINVFDNINNKDFEIPPADSFILSGIKNQSFNGISIAPQHHMYTNDELASYCSSIQELIPKAVILLNQKQADDLSVTSDDKLTISSDGFCFSLPCTINNSVADHVILVPFTQFVRAGTNIKVASNNSGVNGGKNG